MARDVSVDSGSICSGMRIGLKIQQRQNSVAAHHTTTALFILRENQCTCALQLCSELIVLVDVLLHGVLHNLLRLMGIRERAVNIFC